ncbi:MAG: hypothetical protein RQ736_11250 [Thiogranum sp.]|nr:hypothetical protein [Thiogranum sp.]
MGNSDMVVFEPAVVELLQSNKVIDNIKSCEFKDRTADANRQEHVLQGVSDTAGTVWPRR